MSKAAKWILGIIIALAVVAGGGYLYLRYTSNQANAASLSQYAFTRLTTGEIDTTVAASGTVRTNQSANVSWQVSGVIGKINVKVGDKVTSNEIIASLDPNNLPNAIVQAQQNLITDQQTLSDLQNNKASLPTLQQAIIDAQTAVDNAQTARDALNYPRGTADQIAAAQAQVAMAQQKVNEAQSFYKATPGDPTTDARKAQALANLEAANTALVNSQSNLQYIQGAPSASDIAAANNTLALAKAQLADAQRARAQSNNGIDASTLAADQAKINADNSIIDEQNLRAPFDGTVTEVDNQVGDIVSPGTTTFRIDDLSSYYIDMAVSEIDIIKVNLNDPVSITFDAIPNKTYNGIVSYISQVGTTTSGVVNFTVTVKMTDPDSQIKPGMTAAGNIVVSSVKNVLAVPSKAIKTVNGKKVVYVLTFTNASGQTVNPFAQAGRQSNNTTGNSSAGQSNNPSGNQTNSQGTTPNRQTTAQAPSNTLANLKSHLTAVEVTVGVSNDTETQISSSQLKEGDLIVTNPTATTTSSTTTSGGGFGGGFLFGRGG